jgi:hypothetical protein
MYFLLVIPDAEPTGPAFGRPDDRLREAIQNLSPAPISEVQNDEWIPGSRRSLSSGRASYGPVGRAPE